MDRETKALLSKSENRAVCAAQWLVSALLLINAGFALFSFREISHIGVRWVIFGAVLSAVSVIISVAFVVLFIVRLVHIKPFKKMYIALFIAFLLTAAFEILRGAAYTADLFGGTREVVTNEFTVPPAATVSPKSATTRLFLYDNGEDMVFYIPKNIADEFREIPLIISPEGYMVISEHGLTYHTENISVKYFLHSKIVAEIQKVENANNGDK